MRIEYPDADIVIGKSPNGKELLRWKLFNALAICGMGGSGKTLSAAYWLTQYYMQNVRIVLADPHAAHHESLFANTQHIKLSMPCVDKYEDITTRIQEMYDLGKRRIDNTEHDHYPIMFVIDEFASYVVSSADARKSVIVLLNAINQFRKVNIRMMLISQSWASAIRVAGLRDAISDSVVLRSARNNAIKFCSASMANVANQLRPGMGIFADTIVRFPMLTATDKLVASEFRQKMLAPLRDFAFYDKDEQPITTF